MSLPNEGPRTQNILERANEITAGDRQDFYGHPEDNHTTTARMFSNFIERKYGLRLSLDSEDVCVFNVLQKLSRDAHAPKRDNLVDACGYLRNIEQIRDRQ